MRSTAPILLNLSLEINGEYTDCGIRKTTAGGEDSYTVCTAVGGTSREFRLVYDAELRTFSFHDPGIPEELRLLENEISSDIHAQAKSEVIDFMNKDPKDSSKGF